MVALISIGLEDSCEKVLSLLKLSSDDSSFACDLKGGPIDAV
jgi:hypothetical protein